MDLKKLLVALVVFGLAFAPLVSAASDTEATNDFSSSAVVMPVEVVTAANTITTADCGKTFFLNSATEFASTLPAASSGAGCRLDFYVQAAPSGANYTIVSNGSENLITAGVNELEVDTSDDGPYLAAADTITIVQAVAVQGDVLKCVGNGTSWYCHGQTNADGGITVTQAS